VDKLKIVAFDNFDRETVSEFVVVENIKKGFEQMLLKPLVDSETNNGDWCYKLVSDDYKPYDATSMY